MRVERGREEAVTKIVALCSSQPAFNDRVRLACW